MEHRSANFPLPPEPSAEDIQSNEFKLRSWPPRFDNEHIERQYLEASLESTARTRVICVLLASLLAVLSPFTAKAMLAATPELIPIYIGGALLVQLPLFLLMIWVSLNKSWSVRFTAPLILILMIGSQIDTEYFRLVSIAHSMEFPSTAPFLGLCLGGLVFGLPMRQIVPALAVYFLAVKGYEFVQLDHTSQRNTAILVDSFIVALSLIAGLRMDLARRQGFARLALTEQRAYHDPLTSLCNRWGFERDAERIVRHAARERRAVTLAIIAPDHFNQIIDAAGNAVGDSVLSQIGACLNQHIRRPLDSAGRIGADEFALLWYTPRDEFSSDIGDRIVASVRALAIPHPSMAGHVVTVSVGVATLVPKGNNDLDRLMRIADEQLYLAKSSGRDTCRAAPFNVVSIAS